jgi:plastocyanin
MMGRAVMTLVALSFLIPGSVGAATKQVVIADNSFTPKAVSIRVGDLVRWARDGGAFGEHNVRQVNRRPIFYSGAPTSNSTFSFRRRFSAGAFRYKCDVHGTIMSGSVRVPVVVRRAPAGLNFGVQWATGRTNTGGRYDVQFRVGSGRWRPWRTDTKSVKGVFGKGGGPVRVANGKRYSLRARSQVKKSESDWSPIQRIRP